MIRNGKRFRILRKTFTWRAVDQCNLLQFGGTSLSGLGSLAKKYQIGVMPLLGEEVNLRVLLRCAVRFKISRWNYYARFVQLSTAKMVIVWHDTIGLAPHLQRHLHVPISLVQNGVRSDVAPVSGRSFRDHVGMDGLPIPSINTYFVFGEQSEAYLRPIVNARYIHAGSFRLNEYALTRKQLTHRGPEGRSLGLIVSFPNKTDVPTGKVRGNHKTFVSVSHFQLSYHSYFEIDAIVAQVATEIACELGIPFSIIGKRRDSDGLEREYFGSISGCESVQVLGHEKGSGYQVVESFTHLLAIDSTLGYEMLALGKRVGFIANRLRVAGIASEELTFGHPLSLPADGPFWTSASTPAGIREFILRLLKLSDSDWAEQHRTVSPRLMRLDPGNTMLRAHIDSILVQSK